MLIAVPLLTLSERLPYNMHMYHASAFAAILEAVVLRNTLQQPELAAH